MNTRIAWSVLSILALSGIAATVVAHDDGEDSEEAETFERLADEAATRYNPAISHKKCKSGFAGEFPCRNIDLISLVPISELGSALESGATFVNDIWGWTDPKTNRDYALVGMKEGLAIVDLSRLGRPAVMGVLPTHSTLHRQSWRDVKVYADHAFVVSEHTDHGMQVFDLRQLRHTNISGGPVIFSETAHYDGVGRSHNIAINEFTGFAYIVGSQTCSGGLHMVNITDPANPTFAGCFGEHEYVHDAQCATYRGVDTDYIGHEICFSSATHRHFGEPRINSLSISDVTDKNAPVSIASVEYVVEDGYSHQGWLTPDQSYFLHGDETDELIFGNNTRTRIWDVRDLDNPAIIGMFDNTTTAIDHNIYTEGKYAYEANYTSGLRIHDLSNVATGTLTEAAYFDVYPENDNASFEGGAWSSYPYFRHKGLVVVSSMDRGLFVLRVRLDKDDD